MAGGNTYRRLVCKMCELDHPLYKCEMFKKLSPEDRLKTVLDLKLCVNCLREGHFANRCMRQATCSVPGCGRKHSTFLHQPRFKPDQVIRSPATTEVADQPELSDSSSYNITSKETEQVCSFTGAGRGSSNRTALPIVPVKVYPTSGGRCIETYALLDSGSTNTFC